MCFNGRRRPTRITRAQLLMCGRRKVTGVRFNGLRVGVQLTNTIGTYMNGRPRLMGNIPMRNFNVPSVIRKEILNVPKVGMAKLRYGGNYLPRRTLNGINE